MRIIDCHCHLGPHFNFMVPGPQPEDMIISMDNIGIDAACISPHMCLTSDIAAGNQYMIDTVKRFPGRFIGYVVYNPHYEGFMRGAIPDYFSEPGIVGIKIHQGTHMTNLKNKAYEYIFKYADRYRLPILIHAWGLDTIKEIEELSPNYPDASFIMGHFGAVPANMEYAAGVVRSRENVYGDTAVSMMYEKNIEWLAEIAGADKVLFGTDMPFFDPRICMGRILGSDLCESDKEKILGNNMQGILERVKKYEDA